MITILYSLRIVRSDGCKCITGMGENRKSGSEKSRRAEGCQLPEEIARHKLFRLISSGNRSPQTFSAHFLRKSPATKLFRLISSGNRPPQTFSAHFLRKSAATKLFRLISSGNRPSQNFSAHFLRKSAATNFFGSFPQEIAGMGFHSFPQEIARHKTFSANCLRKSHEKGLCRDRGSLPGTGCIRNVTEKTSSAAAALLFFS